MRRPRAHRGVDAELDPVKDHLAIHRLVTAREFPWDYGRGLELAILRTCCVPSIARILVHSGEFRERGQKRYDDTRILLGELVRNGYDSTRGRQAIRQVNRAHRPFDIDREDMLYVLSTFVFEPTRWIERWAWRPLTATEKQASFHFYRAVGRRLGVAGIPEDLDEFERFNRDFERRNFAHTPQTRDGGADVLRLYAAMYWRPVRPVAAAVWRARLDEQALAALGIGGAPRWARLLNAVVLRAHATAERVAPAWTAAAFDRPDARTYPGYPCGYHLSDIGPAHARGEVSQPGEEIRC